MADSQIHPFDKSGVQPTREAQPLQAGRDICLCPQAHHVGHPNQLAPKVSSFSPDRRSAPLPPATDALSSLVDFL